MCEIRAEPHTCTLLNTESMLSGEHTDLRQPAHDLCHSVAHCIAVTHNESNSIVSAREVLIALAQFDLCVCESLNGADCAASLQRTSAQERSQQVY
jgi:hypothetical protein